MIDQYNIEGIKKILELDPGIKTFAARDWVGDVTSTDIALGKITSTVMSAINLSRYFWRYYKFSYY